MALPRTHLPYVYTQFIEKVKSLLRLSEGIIKRVLSLVSALLSCPRGV